MDIIFCFWYPSFGKDYLTYIMHVYWLSKHNNAWQNIWVVLIGLTIRCNLIDFLKEKKSKVETIVFYNND